MENGFTPGPWRADGEDVFSGHTCQATHVANANPIKDMFQSTARANALLIAAAPDLLEALEAMVMWFGTEFAGGPAVKARAAIAKARDMGELHDDRGED